MQKLPTKEEIKRINARIMKWREMMKNGLFADQELLIKRTRKGIPSCLRMKVWPQLIKLKNNTQKKSLTYSKILLKDSYDVYDINLDVPRTFSFQSQQILRNSLFNVLKALSVQFPQIGYCQGMNFLTMRLLQIMDDQTTFYIICYLIKKHSQIYDNFRNPGFVTRQNQVFKYLLRKYYPKINQKLDSDGIDPVMYTPSWFVTLFSKSLSNQMFYRFFDCFLLQGYTTIYKTALTLIKLKQNQILENTSQQNFQLILDMDYYQKINNDQFIQLMSSFVFTQQTIFKMQKQYSNQHRNSLAKIQLNIQQTLTKKKGKNHVEWTLEQFKKVQTNFIEFSDSQQ